MPKAHRKANRDKANIKLKHQWEKQAARTQRIQGAIFAALGCTTIDYRSPLKMNEAATQIAKFVESALDQKRH